MAKITARNCTEVARVGFSTSHDYTGILVLRSDRRILARYTGSVSGGYNLLPGRIKAGISLDRTVLVRVVESHPTWVLTDPATRV